MTRRRPAFVTFLAELKRRRVVRVLVVYLASAFAVLEAADILIPALSMPGWTLHAIIVLLGIGLPVTVLLSWAYDITPEGVVLTESVEEGTAPRPSISPLCPQRSV